MDVTTFCIVLMFVLTPMMLLGVLTFKTNGLFGFIYGGMLGLLTMVMANLVNVWALLVFIVFLTAYVFFTKR